MNYNTRGGNAGPGDYTNIPHGVRRCVGSAHLTKIIKRHIEMLKEIDSPY